MEYVNEHDISYAIEKKTSPYSQQIEKDKSNNGNNVNTSTAAIKSKDKEKASEGERKSIEKNQSRGKFLF